jgi:cellulose synthase/poly-beta-1,6-N-acetylglucosamine synthase-like glycosyltransferase
MAKTPKKTSKQVKKSNRKLTRKAKPSKQIIETSIIITSFKEPKTIKKAITQVLQNKLKDFEILVTAPDDETLDAAKSIGDKHVRLIRDPGKGKPAALNLAVKEAKGKVLVLTDGDVYVGEDSLNEVLKFFKYPSVGAATGNPVSLSPRNTKLGYWAYVLTKIADRRRKRALQLGRRFFCSGYLIAIKKELFPKLPESLLSEDGFISHNVYKNKYKIAYANKARVYVKYPTTFSDWIKQKRRSAGGYNQINKLINVEIRSFRKEASGAFDLFDYANNLRELFWIFELYIARVYLWALIYKDINLSKKTHKEIWQRVETTK